MANLSPEEVAKRLAAHRARKASDREFRAKLISQSVEHSLRCRYGMTKAALTALLTHQNGLCAICGSQGDAAKKRGGLHVDHDHTTGLVRGLLCGHCNLGLGFLKDSVDRLARAIEYLAEPPAGKIEYSSVERPPKPTRNPHRVEVLKIECLKCGTPVLRAAKDELWLRAKGKEGPFCSRKCTTEWYTDRRAPVPVKHGTTSGYSGPSKCRCDDCKRAHTDAARDLSARKRAAQRLKIPTDPASLDKKIGTSKKEA